MKLTKGYLAAIVIIAVILIDQILKIWVKTHFFYGEELLITDWFRLFFIENNGMAFGFEFGSKLLLTWFRIIAVALFIYYIIKIKGLNVIKRGYIVCLSLITAGAAGNVIDCIFYGLIFNNPSYPEVATMFPPDGGYSTLFHGRVVDMLYFPLASWDWPNWIPYIGGDHFIFFQPIFNIADAALSVGVVILILFYSSSLSIPVKQEVKKENDESSETSKDD
ncbi:MAG: lipoprotein signal peptidase [Muribaculaceae bacterium]